jgi:hypothetical protein
LLSGSPSDFGIAGGGNAAVRLLTLGAPGLEPVTIQPAPKASEDQVIPALHAVNARRRQREQQPPTVPQA